LFWTIAISLLFSWLVAIWLTPYFCTLLLKPGAAEEARENPVLRWYRAILKRAIAVRYVTIAVVVALFASAIAMFSLVPAGFFPTSTRAQFVIDYFLPQGTDISSTRADLLEIEAYVRGLDGVTGTNAAVGGGHLRFMLIYEAENQNSAYGQILVDVEDFSQIDGLRSTLQTWIDDTYPASNAKVWKFVLGPGSGSRVEARFSDHIRCNCARLRQKPGPS